MRKTLLTEALPYGGRARGGACVTRFLTAHVGDGPLLNGRTLPLPAYPHAVRLAARDIGYPLPAKPLWD